MPFINMIRIWPPPRWPLIAKAKKIAKGEGIEALRKWAETLSQEETEAFAAEILDLLSESSGKTLEEVYQAILKGGPPL